MPMGDELASTSLNFAQKSMEMSVELIKMLAPLVQKLWKLSGKIADAPRNGEVSRGGLLLEANKSNSAILSTSNFLSSDAEKIAAKAKEYGIPVSFVGNGEKVTLNYLERDTAVIKQIETEIVAERLKGQPQDYKHFKINENNITAMKAEFEQSGVECQFTRSANGETYCTFPAKDAEKVELIKQDFKAMRNEVAENFKAEPSETGLGTITDVTTGKTVDLNQLGGKFKKGVKKDRIVNLLQKEFGYSPSKADLAANKLCDDLKLNAEEYLSRSRQWEMINSLKTNIRYESDSILMRDVTFSEVNFKDGNNTHISVSFGDKSVVLTPDTMSAEEMKRICVSELGMKEEMADETVHKTDKINKQINSKTNEIKIDRTTGVAQEVRIERTKSNSFSVKLGSFSKSYNFNDERLVQSLAKDLGISSERAGKIVEKAKAQSAFQNNISNTAKRMADAAKKNVSRGTETVARSMRKGAK